MKEELQDQLAQILASMQAAASRAGDFAMAQLPDIAQQYVVYGRVKSVALTILVVLFATALGSLSRWAYFHPWNSSPYSWDKGAKRSESNQAMIAIPGAFAVALVFLALISFDWLVWVAPKVWLLKEIAGLVK